MKTFALIAAGTLTLMFGLARAESDADPVKPKPLDQAIQSVDKNLEKHPDNKGLQNAKHRLQENQDRQEMHRMDRAERMAGMERPERAERAQRPEPVERGGRR